MPLLLKKINSLCNFFEIEQIKVFSDPTNFSGVVNVKSNIKVETNVDQVTYDSISNKFYTPKKGYNQRIRSNKNY